MDPEGFEIYLKVLQDPVNVFLPFVSACAEQNPEAADLQVKCLSLFIFADKCDLALKAATALCEKHVGFWKTARAVAKFESYLKDKTTTDEKDGGKSAETEAAAKFRKEIFTVYRK